MADLAYKNKIDVEANQFAMCLLMPEAFLRADIEKLGGVDPHDHQTIDYLAKRYGVDRYIMAARIGQLL